MNKAIIEGETFTGIDYTQSSLAKGDYENCSFINCVFSNADLSTINFIECHFEDCNFSMAKVNNTAFRDVKFKNSKLLGFRFDICNPFLISFEFSDCILRLSSFYRLKIKNTSFNNCDLQEVDFTESSLVGARFNNCDFNKAIFDNTILERADFRSSYNYTIDPEANEISRARFSISSVVGLLGKYNIDLE